MKVEIIENGVAIQFMKDNHARQEYLFIRPQDVWFGAFDGDKLVGVCGLTRKKGYTKYDCMLVSKQYRGSFAYPMLRVVRNKYVEEHGLDDKIVMYSLATAIGNEEKDGWRCVQTFCNGTKKFVKEKSDNE